MKKLAILLFVTIIFLTGCNTIAGVGKDVQKGGQVIEDTFE